MLKKIITLSILVSSCVLVNAQSKSVLSNGFYVNVGLAFPSSSFTATQVKTTDANGSNTVSDNTSYSSQSMGTLPNIEIGNQWYFWKNDKMGFGLRASWFQFGLGSYNLKAYGQSFSVTNVDLRFIKLAPQFTYAFTKSLAVDVSFEVAPALNLGYGSQDGVTFATASAGLLYAPGIKLRYKVFAVGFDYGFGSISTAQTLSYSANTNVGGLYSFSSPTDKLYSGKSSFAMPRIYVGFKF